MIDTELRYTFTKKETLRKVTEWVKTAKASLELLNAFGADVKPPDASKAVCGKASILCL